MKIVIGRIIHKIVIILNVFKHQYQRFDLNITKNHTTPAYVDLSLN